MQPITPRYPGPGPGCDWFRNVPPDDGSRTPATWKDLWPRPETLVVAKLHLLQMAPVGPVPRMTIIHQYPENLCV